MTAVAEQTGAWLAEFTNQPKAEPWIQKLREDAFERFMQLGFPTTRNEEWRFTNVAPIARGKFDVQPSAACNIPEEAKPYLAQHADFKEHAFVALNTAFLQEVQLHARAPRQGSRTADRIDLPLPSSPRAASPRIDRRGRGRAVYHYRNLRRRGRPLHQRRHRVRSWRWRRGRSLQGPARIARSLPCRHHAGHRRPQRQLLLA